MTTTSRPVKAQYRYLTETGSKNYHCLNVHTSLTCSIAAVAVSPCVVYDALAKLVIRVLTAELGQDSRRLHSTAETEDEPVHKRRVSSLI